LGAVIRGAARMSKLAYDNADEEVQSFDGSPLPSLKDGWSQKRDPMLQTVGYRRVKLNSGRTRTYYKQIIRADAVKKLRERSAALLKEINTDDTRALVNRERRLLKSPRRLPNKALKRLRKRAAKKLRSQI
jgi:hypothetical protein